MVCVILYTCCVVVLSLKAQVSAGLRWGSPAERQFPLHHFVWVCDRVIRTDTGQCVCARGVERELSSNHTILQHGARLHQKTHERARALHRYWTKQHNTHLQTQVITQTKIRVCVRVCSYLWVCDAPGTLSGCCVSLWRCVCVVVESWCDQASSSHMKKHSHQERNPNRWRETGRSSHIQPTLPSSSSSSCVLNHTHTQSYRPAPSWPNSASTQIQFYFSKTW